MEDRRAWVRSVERAAFTALVLALAGCGHTQRAGEGPTEGPKDGPKDQPSQDPPPAAPRLLSWQLQATGTSPLLLGLFDSLRGVHCRFLPDEQGELRCLPIAPPTLEVASEFADAGCTERVYSTSHLDNVAGVVGRPVAVPLAERDCETRYVVGTLRELAGSEPRFSGIPGDCRQFTPLELEPGEHRFVVAQVSSPAAWLSAREVDGPLIADGLRLQRFAAQGEAAFPARLLAKLGDEACTLQQLTDRLVCVPPTLSSYSGYFADAECQTQPVWRTGVCSRAAYIGSPGDMHALGEAWEGPIFSQGKVCEGPRDDARLPGEKYFLRGEALGLDALPASEWTNEGSERLQLRGLRASDGSFVALSDELFDGSSQRRYPFEVHMPRFFDAETGEGCAPVWTRDAGVRCAPKSTAVDPYTYSMYADPTCTEPVYFCPSSVCPQDLVLMAFDENGEYRAVSRNRAIALPDAAPTYQGAGGTCRENTGFSGGLMKAGEIVAWDSFPELREVNGRAPGAP